jgi:hypothetical protein
MNQIDVIAVVEFRVDRDEPGSKAWKRLEGTVLEQLLTLPELVLRAGSLLELELDGKVRELRVESLRWNQPRQMLRALLVPTEALAASVDEQGLRAWRPWVAKRAGTAFLDRCRASGWSHKSNGASPPPAAAPAAAAPRREPTL